MNMQDLLVAGKQIEDAYKLENKKITDNNNKMIIGLIIIAFIVFFVGEALLKKAQRSVDSFFSILFDVLRFLLPVALIGGCIYLIMGFLLQKKEDEKGLKSEYKKKFNDAIFYESFERYFSISDFRLKDENSTLMKPNRFGIPEIDFNDMLFEDLPFSYSFPDTETAHLEILLESHLSDGYRIEIKAKEQNDDLFEKTVKLDSNLFNTAFTITCDDRQTVFKVITPLIANKILELNKQFGIKSMEISSWRISFNLNKKVAMLENDDETITSQGVISSARNQLENLATFVNLAKTIQLSKF